MIRYVTRRVIPIDLTQALRKSSATGVGTPGTGIGEEGDPSPSLGGSRATPAVAIYRKAQKAHHSEDCERWEEDDVSATLDAEGQAARTATVVYTPEVASTLTAGVAATPGVSVPGRRSEDDTNMVALAIDGRSGNSAPETGALTANMDTARVANRRTGVVYTGSGPVDECGCCPHDPKPDSARYRAVGNAVTVSTVEYIAWLMKTGIDWGNEDGPQQDH